MLPTGTTLQGGKYRIERVLGQGGFGITYLAKYTSNGRKVAIKELFMGKSPMMMINTRSGNMVTVISPEYRNFFMQQLEKFRKEAYRLKSLSHPNLVKVSDYFEENGTAYYAMSYIEGETLLAKQEREGKLPEKLVLNYLNQLISALKEAHKQNIWHLDIKPANIMVDSTNHVYLIDFGASKHIEQGGMLTTSLAIAGTERYCPPEQLVEDKERFDIFEIGAWSDIYALGATMYNLLTTNNPPHYLTINRKGANAFEFPSSVSSSTRDMIVRMMMPDIKDRPQMVDEIISEVTIVEEPRQNNIEKISGAMVVENRVAPHYQTQMHPQTNNANKSNAYNHKKEWASSGLIIGMILFFVAIIVGGYLLVQNSNRIGTHPELQKTDEKFNVNIAYNNDGSITFHITKGLSFNMRLVKAGVFTMGATSEIEHYSNDEKPVHKVTLTRDYYIGETEVTQCLWKTIMGKDPSALGKSELCPVNFVNYLECQYFIKKLNAISGVHFRLPTEAEWEFAARGGIYSKHYQYSGSNNWGDVAWCSENTSNAPNNVQPIKTTMPNELGIYDMSGNVSEWCQDWYGKYTSKNIVDPTGPIDGKRRVCRGGDVGVMPSGCTVSCRTYNLSPHEKWPLVGFRLALTK